ICRRDRSIRCFSNGRNALKSWPGSASGRNGTSSGFNASAYCAMPPEGHEAAGNVAFVVNELLVRDEKRAVAQGEDRRIALVRRRRRDRERRQPAVVVDGHAD